MKCKYEHDGDCCHAGADQYMCKCKKPCEFIWSLSNADHIRSMSDEELTKWIVEFMNDVLQANNLADEYELDSGFAVDMNIWFKKPYKGEL